MSRILNVLRKKLGNNHISTLNPFTKAAIIQADVFNPTFYRKQIGGVELSDRQALNHYLTKGWKQGHDPSPGFSTQGYLEANPDVQALGINPMMHYVRRGIQEERSLGLDAKYDRLGLDYKYDTLGSDSEYQARIDIGQSKSITAWVVNKKKPGQVFDVRILLDGLLYSNEKNNGVRGDLKKRGVSEGLGGVEVNLPMNLMEAGKYIVSLQVPDGGSISKEITIAERSGDAFRDSDDFGRDVAINIVVPIYNAAEDVAICIERLKSHTPQGIEIILIDDCSPDPAIKDILETVQGDPRFRVLANSENLGFTQTVNRGLKEASDADVIILNSDARVTPKWCEGLHRAAYSRPNVATVTAMSDRAGAFSAPNIGNENVLPSGVDEVDFATAFRRRSLRLYPEVPTGNGFCMYIRRAGIDALGALDEKAFPRGYGEENDYCMRALRAGWVNLIDDATYVFHERTKSFDETTKAKNIAAGRKVVDQRYPEYKILIQRFHTSGLIKMARYRARLALIDCSNGKGVLPRALFVTATQSGGTPQTNADLMGALDDAFETFVLSCSSRHLELARYENGMKVNLRRYSLSEAIEPASHRSSEYDLVIEDWLRWLDADIVHIRHLGWHSLSLPKLAKRSGAQVFYSLHDFYTLCPSLKLLDDDNVFCNGVCTATEGTCQAELWKPGSFPDLKKAWVYQWREEMAKAIECCDGFITTSQSARARVLRHMPSIPPERFHVIPHGRDFLKFEQLQNDPNLRGPVRILIPGNIDEPKGLKIITEVLRLDVQRKFEFHILGTINMEQTAVPRLIQHGRYQRKDFAQKVSEIAPHFGAVLSIWDETFCHTLTEMWSVGLPVAVLDFPTLRARVENSKAGWVIDDITPEGVHAALTEIANDHDAMKDKGDAAVAWQSQRGAGQSCRKMAASYLSVYRNLQETEYVPNIAVVVPTKTKLQGPNASSEIRVWERTRNSLERPVNYIRMDVEGLLANMEMGEISGAIIQRTALQASDVRKFADLAKAMNIPYVYELDDNLMEVPADKDPDGFYASYAPFLIELISNATAVTVSTDLLAEKVRPYNDRVEVVPNKISTRLWGGAVAKGFDHVPRLLYMGTKTHDEDLAFVLPAIKLARETYPSLRLSLIGVTSSVDLPDWVDVIPLESGKAIYSHFVPWLKTQIWDVDLAIAPLTQGEFNRFKSGLKVLDYAALGLPVLASNVPSYQDLVGPQPSVGVLLVQNSVEAWAQTIETKLNQRSELHKQGQTLREWAFENHALQPTLEAYDKLVLTVVTEAKLKTESATEANS